MEEKPVQLVDNTNEQDETNEHEQNKKVEALKKDAHKMAASTLHDLVDNYGYVKDLAEFYTSKYETGVVYAELIDFNKDGVNELFVLLKGSSYIPSPMPHRETDGYSIEIWGHNTEAYVPIYTRNVAIDNCSACDLSVGLIEFEDGTYGYYESTVQTLHGNTFNEETIYFIGSILEFEKNVFKSTNSSTKLYEINGETIAEETFITKRALYNGNVKPIIESDSGTKSFAFIGDSSAGIVAAIYDQVADAFDNINELGTEVESWTVQEESERVLQIFDVRADSARYANQMVAYVILYENVEADLPAQNIFTVVSEEVIANKVEEVFGVKLDTSKLMLPKPTDDITNHLVAYENGAFYIVPTDYPSKTVIRTVKQAWKVANDSYYMVVSDIELDRSGYYEEIDRFMNDSIETWPIEARKWAVSDVRRYLLVKMVDGRPTVKYIGGFPLTLDEIQLLS